MSTKATKFNIDALVSATTKTEKYDFRGQELTLCELSYGQVEEFSRMAEQFEDVDALEANRKAAGSMLRFGIVELAELTDDQLNAMSPVGIKELNAAVLEFNGLNTANIDAEEAGKG